MLRFDAIRRPKDIFCHLKAGSVAKNQKNATRKTNKCMTLARPAEDTERKNSRNGSESRLKLIKMTNFAPRHELAQVRY